MDHIANRLVVAAQLSGNGESPLSSSAGEQDLAAAQDKSILRSQSRLDLLLFGLSQWADKNGCSHTLYCTTFPIASGGNALEAVRKGLGRGLKMQNRKREIW